MGPVFPKGNKHDMAHWHLLLTTKGPAREFPFAKFVLLSIFEGLSFISSNLRTHHRNLVSLSQSKHLLHCLLRLVVEIVWYLWEGLSGIKTHLVSKLQLSRGGSLRAAVMQKGRNPKSERNTKVGSSFLIGNSSLESWQIIIVGMLR